jgi:hypothetical protein
MFVLTTLESYARSLIQSTTPILLLVEDSSKEKILDKFYLALIFVAVLYAKGCMEVKRMELRLRPKECIEHDKHSFPFDEHLAKGEREFFH